MSTGQQPHSRTAVWDGWKTELLDVAERHLAHAVDGNACIVYRTQTDGGGHIDAIWPTAAAAQLVAARLARVHRTHRFFIGERRHRNARIETILWARHDLKRVSDRVGDAFLPPSAPPPS